MWASSGTSAGLYVQRTYIHADSLAAIFMDQLVQYNASKDRHQRKVFPAYKDCLDLAISRKLHGHHSLE